MDLDKETNKILEPKNINVYDQNNTNKYCWIIERNDHYPDQNLVESKLPLVGL